MDFYLPWHDEFEYAIGQQLTAPVAPRITRPFCRGCNKVFYKLRRAITVPTCTMQHQICFECAQDWFAFHDECPECGHGTDPMYQLRVRTAAPSFGREHPCTQISNPDTYDDEPPFTDMERGFIHPHSVVEICFTDGELTRRSIFLRGRYNAMLSMQGYVTREVQLEMANFDWHAKQYYRLRHDRGAPCWTRRDERMYQEACAYLRHDLMYPMEVHIPYVAPPVDPNVALRNVAGISRNPPPRTPSPSGSPPADIFSMSPEQM
ncbi:hypothetical protein CERZMDRAFT_86666 [Cercospora zeae-maydis SCOH1-5]|uniref:Uncharacterized protein n=1 Tax=Cercospora zeae-maydis SCOH1-5 TaxID=717836 RepID=A0A6A6F5F5_9PEZI|nr:hypothetical protein CERZMDRAFT_86666 [Cercospora zeae-maydis SCOH1-5]